MSLSAKIVLKSTTSKTLNDRFTELSRQMKSPPQVTIGGLRTEQMQQFHASAKNRRLAAQMANRPGVQAALGQRSPQGVSIQNRLGNQNQNKPSIQGRLGGNKVARGGRGGQQPRTAASRLGQKRGGGVVSKRGGLSAGGRGRGAQNRLGRGAGRGMQVGNRGGGGGGGGKVRGLRGRGRGGARGRGRGKAENSPTKSKGDLDAELDEYMTHSRSHLDAELDQYMQGTGNDE